MFGFDACVSDCFVVVGIAVAVDVDADAAGGTEVVPSFSGTGMLSAAAASIGVGVGAGIAVAVGVAVASFGTGVSSATAPLLVFAGEGNAVFLLPVLVGDDLDGDGRFLEGEGRLLLATDVVGVLRGVVVPRGVFAAVRGVGSLNLDLVRGLPGDADARSGGGARSCLRRTILGGEGEGAAVVVVVVVARWLVSTSTSVSTSVSMVVVPSATP